MAARQSKSSSGSTSRSPTAGQAGKSAGTMPAERASASRGASSKRGSQGGEKKASGSKSSK